MVCAPSTTALSPLAHTLLTSVQGTLLGMPALSAACVAGACAVTWQQRQQRQQWQQRQQRQQRQQWQQQQRWWRWACGRSACLRAFLLRVR
jgi:uncharacterized protein HemX